MKTFAKTGFFTLIASLALAPVALVAQQTQPAQTEQSPAITRPGLEAHAQQPLVAKTAAAQPKTLQDAIQGGKVFLDARLRCEIVDQAGYMDNATAITLSTLLGYTTASYHGLDASVLAENTVALTHNYWDSINPAANPVDPVTKQSKYSQVQDPNTTEVAQAWLRYTTPAGAGINTQVTLGRQRIRLDNGRFIGDGAWRQDHRTFDSVRVQNTSVKNLTITYAWLWRLNRHQADARDWRSNSHLINLSYAPSQYATLTAYGYLLDFYNPSLTAATGLNAALQAGSKTFGASLAGNPAINKQVKVNYRLEYARQNNYGHNHLDYSAGYLFGEVGASYTDYGLSLGYEQLGSDNGKAAFQTPAGGNHGFNGWADFIVPTGAAFAHGLRSSYLKASTAIPAANLQILAYYYKQVDDYTGKTYGNEINASVAYKLSKNISFLVKGAFFDGNKDTVAALAPAKISIPAHLNKFWIQTEYTF